MKIKHLKTRHIFESLRPGEYFIWNIQFQDGETKNVKIRWDETSQQDLEKHFGKPILNIDYNFGIHGDQDVVPDRSSYHADQDKAVRNQNDDRATGNKVYEATANRATRRAAEFGNIDQIMAKQHAEKPPAKKYEEIQYNGWTLKWSNVAGPEGKFKGLAIPSFNKFNPITIQAGSPEEAKESIQKSVDDFLNKITEIKSTSVTIDFNIALSRDVLHSQANPYAIIYGDQTGPQLFLSYKKEDGMHRTSDRRAIVHKTANPDAVQHSLVVSGKEAKEAGLKHARYTLGPKEDMGDGIMAFPLVYHSPVIGDNVRLSVPGITVVNKNLDEASLTELYKTKLNEFVKESAMSDIHQEISEYLNRPLRSFKAGKMDSDHLGDYITRYGELLARKYNTDVNSMQEMINKYVEGEVGNTPDPINEGDGPPKVGDTIRTKKMQMEGKVLKLGTNRAGYPEVFFKVADGRTMVAPVSNVVVIEKLADDELEVFEETYKARVDSFLSEIKD